MGRGDLPLRFNAGEVATERLVERFIGGLITTCGYEEIICDLVSAVYQLGRASLANPHDHVTHRDFYLWANAVRAAILKHGAAGTFEELINNFDRSLAQRMGIILS